MNKIPLDISQKLTGNNNQKYFFKNCNYKLTGKNKTGYCGYFDKKNKPALPYHKHIIPDELVNYPINEKDNIICPLVVDTEFTAYINDFNKLSKDKLKNVNNRQLIQIDRLNYLIKKHNPDLKGIYELTKSSEVQEVNVDLLEDKDFKAVPTIHLTTQIKHVLYNDEEILVNPRLKDFYEKFIKDKNYLYPYYNENSQSHIFDYLTLKGIDFKLSDKIDYSNNLEKEEFKKYPTCTFKLYAYFLLADLPKIFQNELLIDLKEAFKNKRITQERRLKTNGYCQQWHTFRLININGIDYRLVFDLVDLGSIQGAISLNTLLENLGMDTSNKNLLDDLKDNMLLAMIERPEDFKKYALGDLIVYEAYIKHNDSFKQIYKENNIINYFTETKLTIGATANDFQQNMLLKELDLKIPNTENIDKLKYFTIPASSGNLKKIINSKERRKEETFLKKQIISKVRGGRCYNNRLEINTISTEFTLADIDITGAYSTIASTQFYYFGCPVIQKFVKHKVTLRKFLKYYEKKYLIKRGFVLAIETKNNLNIEQDLIPSWNDLRFIREKVLNEQETIFSIDLQNTSTSIYTKELINSTITWDELNIIRSEWNKKQIDDFLDNVYMISALYYPKNFECKTREELVKNKEVHKRFTDAMPYSVIDNEDDDYNHYWYKNNFGKLIIDKIIQKRAENKKINPTLAYFYKLLANTLYGVNVSRHFETSNILLAANITAMCRCGMYLTEKALNIYQTITDGGICELNEVINLMSKKIDSSLFVRAYQMRNQDLSQNHKWKNTPITENGKRILFKKGKGWLIDGEYYGNIDRDIYVKLSKQHQQYIKIYGENHKLTKQKEIEIKPFEEEIKKLFNKLNKLVINHIKKIFPNNDLFNGEFEKVKVDENGLAIKDINNNYIYEKVIGIFNFEIKNLCNSVSFHGSADYMYKNLKEEITTKMRGYDVKPNIVAWKLENNELIYDIDYYNEKPPIQRFLEDLQNRPESVRIPLPFIKTSILKPAQFSKEFNKTFQYSNLKPGDDFMEIVRIPILTMRFKFQSLKQHKNWLKYYNALKRKYCLSFEIYYINNDGTINYKKMMYEIDKYISEGVINPKKIYDKYNNLKRDIQKNVYIQNYINLINWLKNVVRLSIIGKNKYIIENYTLKNNDVKYKLKKQIHYTKSFYNSYDDVNTYSEDKAFRNYEDNT